jgi:hypothetical protein
MLEVLGNIIFKMLFSMGSLGVRIYNFLIRLCGLTNTAFGYWMDTHHLPGPRAGSPRRHSLRSGVL